MQEQTITALCAALTAQQLPFAQGEPLAPHTTFKIGGPAAFWCTPRDAEQLRRTLQLCRENGVRVYLLGNGSNTLFDDAGFDGAVIDMRGLSGMENSGLDTDAVRITAGAGQTLGRLCSKAQTLGLTGLAGGAAVAGCCAQMVGFAVMSFKENGVGGLVSQGIGTSMLQMPNILKKPRVWLPPIIASAITGPIATCVFKLQMNGPAVSSGMGTCGLVGQIGVYTGWVADVASGAKAGITAFDWAGLLLVSFVLPTVLCAVLGALFRKKGWIKDGDLKLD